MHHFMDSKGESWPISITGGTIKRAKDYLDVDLGNPPEGDPPFITRFDTDMAFKVDVLFVTCMLTAEERKVRDVDFAELLEGEVLHAAADAFWGALSDFFQKLGQPHVVTAIKKQQEMITKAFETANKTMTNEEYNKKIEQNLDILGKSLSNMLQSPESTPTDGPLES